MRTPLITGIASSLLFIAYSIDRTSRTKGIITPYNSVVAKYIINEIPLTNKTTVLDFGAGKYALTAEYISSIIPAKISAYDFPDVMQKYPSELFDPKAASKKYDIVYASRVLNVQETPEQLNNLIHLLSTVVKRGGILISNDPAPRKMSKRLKEPTPQRIADSLISSGFDIIHILKHKKKQFVNSTLAPSNSVLFVAKRR